jgi:hypothetical protein
MTSTRIFLNGWSPDGRYLSFLSQTREEMVDSLDGEGLGGPLPGTVHFYDVETGEHCQYPQTQRNSRTEGETPAESGDNQPGLDFNRWVGWLPEGRLLVLTRSGELGVLDSPCSKGTPSTLPGLAEPVEEVFLGDAGGSWLLIQGESGCLLYDIPGATALPLQGCARSASFSPGGDRLAINVHQLGSNFSTLVFDTSTGKSTRTIEWTFTGEAGDLAGPIWLDARRFLISRTDAGPQLVTLGADFQIQAIAETFFGVPGSANQTSEVFLSPDGNAFHLLLINLQSVDSAGEKSAWLYHSESQHVEKLHFSSADFSPGGRYLDLVKSLIVNEIEELEHWLRNVDPEESKAVRLTATDDQNFPSLSQDGRVAIARIAEPGSPTTLIVKSVSNGEVLETWFVDPYTYQLFWSPTGGVLAALGDGQPGGDQALYLLSTPAQ